MAGPENNPELEFLDRKLEEQRIELAQWRRPSEVLIFEILRALDRAYCEELFVENERLRKTELHHRSLLTWGVNKALATLMPDELLHGPFRFFPSKADTQEQTDFFLLKSGILERAELLRGLLAEGLLSARLDTPARVTPRVSNVLVLKANHPSLVQQNVALTQRRWLSSFVRQQDSQWEHDLEQRHLDILPELEARVSRQPDWGMSYSSTEDIDAYFLEWGQVYLRRIGSQDLIGLEEKIGGNQFNEYLGVLAALSGRSQKHLCYAMIVKKRHPELDIRNLLTTFVPCNEFLSSLAHFLDTDTLYLQKLLASLTLEPANKASHLNSARTAWSPIVRVTHEHYILPMFGMEINPFLFLLNDLRSRYPKDWHEAANNREARWLRELKAVLEGLRWKVTEKNLVLRDGSRTVTDVDFLAYDPETNEVALFQLKWQQIAGVDTRARRSAAKNLVSEGNRWISSVGAWLGCHGVRELGRRARFDFKPDVHVELFVLARYEASFPAIAEKDDKATWADWAHFLKVIWDNRRSSPKQLAQLLRTEANRIENSNGPESFIIPSETLPLQSIRHPSPGGKNPDRLFKRPRLGRAASPTALVNRGPWSRPSGFDPRATMCRSPEALVRRARLHFIAAPLSLPVARVPC